MAQDRFWVRFVFWAELLFNECVCSVFRQLPGFFCVLQSPTNSTDQTLLFPVQDHKRSWQGSSAPAHSMKTVGQPCLLRKASKQSWVPNDWFLLCNFHLCQMHFLQMWKLPDDKIPVQCWGGFLGLVPVASSSVKAAQKRMVFLVHIPSMGVAACHWIQSHTQELLTVFLLNSKQTTASCRRVAVTHC